MLRKNLIKYIPNKMLEIWEHQCETFLGLWSPLGKSQIHLFLYLFLKIEVEISLLENYFPSKAILIHHPIFQNFCGSYKC